MIGGLKKQQNNSSISGLVDSMMEINELFELSFSENNQLSEFLAKKENFHDADALLTISMALRKILRNEMPFFLLAFEHMQATNGYSMINFLKINPNVEKYLHRVIDKLEKVYHHFLLHRAAKNVTELNIDDEEDSAEEIYFDEKFEQQFNEAFKNYFRKQYPQENNDKSEHIKRSHVCAL
ncbi:MAG TPA: hypothetical protein PLD88_09880 [Candidatus Berkiella sp.]|nr:hypothetical protein [Candidatus Berkiella sp.]